MSTKRGPYRMSRHPVTQPSDQSYRLIALTQGQHAMVDTADYDCLNRWNWLAQWNNSTHSFYARRYQSGKYVWMHRVILDCPSHKQCDHANGNTLDNRRANLREATHNQNVRHARRRRDNTTGFKGVMWNEDTHKWKAVIVVDGAKKYLGLFTSKEQAARIYDEAAKLWHGKFAHLNFPESAEANHSLPGTDGV